MSGGHVARLLEEAGIPTVVILAGAFAFRAKAMRIPRTVVTRHPMGRPLGAPFDAERQRQVIQTALDLLETAESNPTVVELPETYRPTPK